MANKRPQPSQSISKTPSQTKKSRAFQRGNSETQFPGKLHDMMDFVERHRLQSTTISWIQNGTGIIIRDPEQLVHILPRFFGQTKYRSFRRQLNMWHFQRIATGPNKGGFMHPFFVKGMKSLCSHMSRYIDPNEFQPSPLSLEAQIQNSDRRNAVSCSSTGNLPARPLKEDERASTRRKSPLFVLDSNEEEEEKNIVPPSTSIVSPHDGKVRKNPLHGSMAIDQTPPSTIDESVAPKQQPLNLDGFLDDGPASDHQPPEAVIVLPSMKETRILPPQQQDEGNRVMTSVLFGNSLTTPAGVELSPPSQFAYEQHDGEESQRIDENKSEEPMLLLKKRSSSIDLTMDPPFPLDEVLANFPLDEGLLPAGMSKPASPDTVRSIFEELQEIEIL